MAVKNVDEYIGKYPDWEQEILTLRELLLSTGLEETIKWGGPVYMLQGKNIVSIGAFKNHCALWSFKGVLLKQNAALLQNAREEKTNSMRQIRFEKGEEIKTEVLRDYVFEAIQNEKQGKKVKAATKKVEIAPELQEAFSVDVELRNHFEALTPGKQREYAEYISLAKRDETRQARLQKIIPMIISGVSLNDKYKK